MLLVIMLATSAVYAWHSAARTLAMRGMLVAPARSPGDPEPLLWRVLQFERCQPLTASWVDIGSAAIGGQIAGIFPIPEPNRGALVYLASSRPLTPRAFDWPPESLQGLDARTFDRGAAEGEAVLADAMHRDQMAAGILGESRFVTRLRFDRRATAPETLTVTLDGVTTTAWARLYANSTPRPDLQPSICRSSVGQPITGYPGAPAALPIDVGLPHAFGSGWHGPEGAADARPKAVVTARRL